MNNIGFFNPFGGSGSGGGGGSTANYSVKAVTDSSGQVSYKLTKNGIAVGDVISFNGSNMLVSYGGELVVLNSAIADIEEALDKTYNFTTFTELEIDTHNKTLAQITDELLTKNLPQNTIVTGQIYTDALPFSGNGEAEVLVNRPAFWWTCKSLTTAPYSWTALTADQALGGVIYDWTPSNYELPTASSSTLGGVKVGEGLEMTEGVLSVIAGTAYQAGSGITFEDVDTLNFITTDPSYVYNKDTLLMNSGSLYYYKKNNGDGYCFIVKTGVYYQPAILSKTNNGALWHRNDGYDNQVEFTFDYLGVTWYLGKPIYGSSTTPITTDFPIITINNYTSMSQSQKIEYWKGKLDEIYSDYSPSNTKSINISPATANSIGGVKVGENVQIASDGTISVITTKGDTGIGIASITKTSSSGLNDIYTITYTDSTTSTFTVTNGATITSGSIGQTGHLILTMSDGRTVDAGVLPTDNEVEVTTTSSQPADPNVELWVDLSTQQTLDIPEINDSSTSSIQDTWSCKKIYDDQQRQEKEIGVVANTGAKNLFDINAIPVKYHITSTLTDGVLSGTSNGDWASYNVPVNLPVGNYIFSAVISNFSRDSGAGEGTIRIRITDGVSGGTTIGTTNITGNGAISIPFSWSGGQFYIQYSFNFSSTESYVNSFTASNSMIRPASITDDTYVPYALPNPTLTPAVIKAVDEGGKNKFTYGDLIGITTNFSDQTFSLPAGSYKLIFTASASTGAFAVRLKDAQDNSIYYITADNVAKTRTYDLNISEDAAKITFYSSVSNDFTNIMICTAADWAVSQKYVPYALTNPELTTKLTADESALGEVINGGAAGTKNLFPSFDTKLSGSVTYSYANGTVSASGTKSSGVNYVDIVENRPISELGLHIGDIIKLYNTSDNLRLDVVLGDGTTFDTAITAGNEVKEVTIGTGKTHIYIRAQILSTVTGTINLSSTPMICRKALYDANPDYEPYAPAKTNVEITPALVEIVDGGGKNLLKVGAVGVRDNYGTTYEDNGVTYTLNSDGTVSLSGTASAESHTNLRLSNGSVTTIDDFCNGNYVLSGCPSGGRGVFNLRARTTDNAYILFDIGSGVTLTNRGAYSSIFISIFVQGGKDCTGLTFSPMVCTAAAWKISQSFQPYRPSWQEMYEMIQALQSGTRSAPALAMSAEPEEIKEPETGEEEMR